MRSMQFYDKLSKLSGYLYEKPGRDYLDWKLLDKYEDNSGVFIELFKTNNEFIFAIRGTEITDFKDLEADKQLANRQIPNQYKAAEKYYNNIKNKYTNIIFTGYSLGGSIAQMLGNEYAKETICFAPFGTADIVKPKHSGFIMNFGNIYDVVFTSNFDKQIGDIYIMNVEQTITNKPGMLKHHFKNYGKPSDSQLYSGKRNKDSLYKKYFRIKQDANKYIRKGLISVDNQLNNVPSKLTKGAKKALNW